MSTLSGACVLCVLVRHLMGSAGCGVAWLKSPSALKSRSYTIGAICRFLPRASLLLGAGFGLQSLGRRRFLTLCGHWRGGALTSFIYFRCSGPPLENDIGK